MQIIIGVLGSLCAALIIASGFLLRKFKILSRRKQEAKEQNQALTVRLQAHVRQLEEERQNMERRIQGRTSELEKNVRELERFRNVAVDRELRMSELKKQISSLSGEATKEGREGSSFIASIPAEKRTEAALLNILEDIQEARVRAERESERTRAVIDHFTDVVLVLDDKLRILHGNKQAASLFGREQSELMGKALGEVFWNNTGAELQAMLGHSRMPIERRDLKARDNLVLEISCVSFVLPEQEKGYLLVLRDVTRDRLVERMKTEFVALSAHQLRTPLSAIKWTLKMFLEGDMGKITKDQAEILQKSYQSNERMIRLINELLEITRMEEGRYLANPVRARMEPLAESIANSFQEEVKRKGIILRLERPDTRLPEVKIDIEKMRQVIMNLVDNAIRYTEKGGRVTVSLKYATKGVECRVEDTGIGIPDSQQKRIFERFFRGSNAIRKETEGSGLGLYISKNIVEAHGGKIWFSSKEGEGSVFTFWIPEAK